MVNTLPMSFIQGKAVSTKNVTIASNKILDDYLSKSSKRDETKIRDGRSINKILSDASLKPVVRKRLDRLDRSTVIQNACDGYDVDGDPFKQRRRQRDIPAVTYTYLRNVLRKNERELNLRNHGIGPAGALVVTNELIDRAQCIAEIDISSNNLCDQGVAAICQFLEKNNSVLKVNFSRNSVKKAGVDAIAHMLAQNERLKYLDLSHNGLTEEDFELMASVLQCEQVLETLELSSNSFGASSGHLFGFLFARNYSLVKICLSCNHIGDEGVRNLVPGLIQNRTIRSLDLSWNDIGNEGAMWMAELITSNSVLRNLNLSYNCITGKGVNHIADSLAVNVILNVLELSGNSLTSTDTVSLLESLLRNSSTKLRQLCLGEVIISPEFENLYSKIRSTHPRFAVSGMVGAAGQPIKMMSTNSAMEALEEYFARNKLDPIVSFME